MGKARPFDAVFSELDGFFPQHTYDAVVSIGARGFILAGGLTYATHKPLLPVRKYHNRYENFDGQKMDFINWKDQQESLFLFNMSHHNGKRVLFLDDVMETDRSMKEQ